MYRWWLRSKPTGMLVAELLCKPHSALWPSFPDPSSNLNQLCRQDWHTALITPLHPLLGHKAQAAQDDRFLGGRCCISSSQLLLALCNGECGAPCLASIPQNLQQGPGGQQFMRSTKRVAFQGSPPDLWSV